MPNGLPQEDGGAAAVTALAGEQSFASLVAAINGLTSSHHALASRMEVQTSEYNVMHGGMVEHATRLQSLENNLQSW